MDYNTTLKKLRMPEYGRVIQSMVDYALTIENREERQRCANTIVSIMGNMFTHLRDVPEFNHKLWDHLAAMADYKLDIDYPYEIVKISEEQSKPSTIPYPKNHIKARHYGIILENLLKHISTMPDNEERKTLTVLALAQMKRSLIAWNKDVLDDEKIISDFEAYTNHQISVDIEELKKNVLFSSINESSFRTGQQRKNRKKN